MKKSLVTLLTYAILMQDSTADARLVWWNPISWVEEAFILSFKVVTKQMSRWSFAGRLKRQIKKDLASSVDEFVDQRALHSISKVLRTNLVNDVKNFIDQETQKEIKQALNDVPWRQRNKVMKANEDNFRNIKAQKLTEDFQHIEPLLLKQLDQFKEDLKQEISQEVELLIQQKFDHIDNVKKFIPYKNRIREVLNDEWVKEISEDFETRAQAKYSKLYREYTKATGLIVQEFEKIKPDARSKIQVSLITEGSSTKSPYLGVDEDIAAPYEGPNGDLIEYKTDQQFAKYLKAKAASEPLELVTVPVSYSYDSPFELTPTLKTLLATPPATIEDALDFVVDIQDKQEQEYMAKHTDARPLLTMDDHQIEQYLLDAYSQDYYYTDDGLVPSTATQDWINSLLSVQGLGHSQTPTLDNFDPRKSQLGPGTVQVPQYYLPIQTPATSLLGGGSGAGFIGYII